MTYFFKQFKQQFAINSVKEIIKSLSVFYTAYIVSKIINSINKNENNSIIAFIKIYIIVILLSCFFEFVLSYVYLKIDSTKSFKTSLSQYKNFKQ